MPTANQELFDAAVRRQIESRRFTVAEAAAVVAILESSDARLVRLLRERLGSFVASPSVDFRGEKFKQLLKIVQDTRDEVMSEARVRLRSTMLEFGKVEADFERSLLELSVPIEFAAAAASAESIRKAVLGEPFYGRTFPQWWDSLKNSDRRLLVEAIQTGISQGETVDQIVRRVVGTRSRKYADGVLSITRRNAETVVLTALSHASAAGREAIWESNQDILAALRWTSVLDGKTTAICRGRDGALAPVGDKPLPKGSRALQPPFARPPAHGKCRSIMVAVIDGMSLVGERPFVVDTRTSEKRTVDFKRLAKEQGRSVSEVRESWASRYVGRVPAEVDYDEFMSRQSAEFQDKVLGKTKARLFRTGKIKLYQFTDRRGKELTLSELASSRPEVFRSASLDPDGF